MGKPQVCACKITKFSSYVLFLFRSVKQRSVEQPMLQTIHRLILSQQRMSNLAAGGLYDVGGLSLLASHNVISDDSDNDDNNNHMPTR